MARDDRHKGETIYEACRSGKEERIEEYVRHNGCLTETDANKMTLLHHAAFSGNMRIVDAVLSAQSRQPVDVDAADNGGWTPLHYAADRGRVAVVERLVDYGANVNAKDDMRRTPLHLAAGAGHTEVLRCLLASGAARNARNVAGMTAQECAEAGGKIEAVQVFEQ